MTTHSRTRLALVAICVALLVAAVPAAPAANTVIGPGNKNALMLCPVSDQFGHSFENVEATLKQGGYTVTKLTHGQTELKNFREFSKYGLVFIFTHGDTVGSTDSVMSTTIPYGYARMYLPNKTDFDSKLLIKQGSWLGGYTVGVKSGYIAKYNKGLPDTFVYLNCCLLMHNNSMYDAYTSCGAKAVAGFERIAWSHEGSDEPCADNKATEGFFEKTALFNADIRSAYNEIYKSTGWCNVTFSSDGSATMQEYPPPCAGWTLKTAYDTNSLSYYLNYQEAKLPEIPDVESDEEIGDIPPLPTELSQDASWDLTVEPDSIKRKQSCRLRADFLHEMPDGGEELWFLVEAPNGKVFGKHVYDVPSEVMYEGLEQKTFETTFPDNFKGANTDLEGDYRAFFVEVMKDPNTGHYTDDIRYKYCMAGRSQFVVND